ncbi:YqeG family HAD IIIA-type phosphatase [Selenihalanaerobacter shriftii]|uniref:YqeG family HAD IIIA-type phosphatase n=1 Tax=Selenihalanaerobacter shriftii TaxID=142842 RepID=A0A1T4QL69_9FIRM|nr:YqeG family HAD IIIA-type phosphatase [Selenihalanaerobacter shriftii]SKA04377.1 hypothetical protein SAMN02745118_02595 [Selenihalanaerobacter shriftii]
MGLEKIIRNLLCPDLHHNNIYEVDLEYLKSIGIEGLICDLDNTLLAWNNKIIRPEIEEWIFKVKEAGISVCILSNSLQYRVSKVSNCLDLPAISKAFKPRKRAFKLAMNILEVNPEKIAVIGDQLFTDIYGGNRLDLLTILVEPIAKKELISTKLIRIIERKVKKYLKENQFI